MVINSLVQISKNFESKILIFFSYPSVQTCVLGTQKNQLIETVLLRTHNMFRFRNTAKPVLSGHSKRRPKLVLKTDNRLMQVKGSILQYF